VAPVGRLKAKGLHLSICKLLLDQLGGEMSFSSLDDGRTHSRLLLPLAAYGDGIPGKPRSLSTSMPAPDVIPSRPE
ncbi:MAG: ATP-binding protein, partial [Cyanobacteria bacterium J06638_6]